MDQKAQVGPYRIDQRKLPVRFCPECARKLDACTGVSGDGLPPIPTIGAIFICAYCGTALLVAEDGFDRATERDFAELQPELQTTMRKLVLQTLGHGIVFAKPSCE